MLLEISQYYRDIFINLLTIGIGIYIICLKIIYQDHYFFYRKRRLKAHGFNRGMKDGVAR